MKCSAAVFPLRHSLILSAAIVACIWGADSVRMASAQVTFTGDVNPVLALAIDDLSWSKLVVLGSLLRLFWSVSAFVGV